VRLLIAQMQPLEDLGQVILGDAFAEAPGGRGNLSIRQPLSPRVRTSMSLPDTNLDCTDAENANEIRIAAHGAHKSCHLGLRLVGTPPAADTCETGRASKPTGATVQMNVESPMLSLPDARRDGPQTAIGETVAHGWTAREGSVVMCNALHLCDVPDPDFRGEATGAYPRVGAIRPIGARSCSFRKRYFSATVPPLSSCIGS
jgi:hypothetical protein